MAKSCIVTRGRNRRIQSVKTPSGLRSVLYDKIASIPVMENRDRAFSFLKKVYSKTFLDKFGDWTNNRSMQTIMTELKSKSDNSMNNAWKSISDVSIVLKRDIESLGIDKNTKSAMLKSNGWYDSLSNTVFIVLDNNSNELEVDSAILHELIIHKGIRVVLGDRFSDVIDVIFSSMSEADRISYIDTYGSEEVSADEFLMHMTKDNVDPDLLQRIATSIINAFRVLGVDIHIAESDMINLLLRSRDNLSDMDNELLGKTDNTSSVPKGDLYAETGEPKLYFRTMDNKLFENYGDALQNETDRIEVGFTTSQTGDASSPNGTNLQSTDSFVPMMTISASTNPSTRNGAINHLIKNGILSGEKVHDRTTGSYMLIGEGRLSDKQTYNSSKAYYYLVNMLGQQNVHMDENGRIRVDRIDKRPSASVNGREEKIDIEAFGRAIQEGRWEELKNRYDNFDQLVVYYLAEKSEFFGAPSGLMNSLSNKEKSLLTRVSDILSSLGIRVMGMTDYIERYGERTGRELDARALADIANGVIAIAEGASFNDVIEEVAHFMVEAYTDQAAVESALSEVENTEEWANYAAGYYETYSKNHSGAELDNIVRREILGKIIKNRILGTSETVQNTGFLARIKELVQNMVNFLRTNLTGQKSEMEKVSKDIEDYFKWKTEATDMFDSSLLAQKDFTLFSDKEMTENQRVLDWLETLRMSMKRMQQVGSDSALSIDATLSALRGVEDQLRSAEKEYAAAHTKASITSIVRVAEAQSAYLKDLVKRLRNARGNRAMTPADRTNIEVLLKDIVPLTGALRTFLYNNSGNLFGSAERTALINRIDQVSNDITQLSGDIKEISREATEEFLHGFVKENTTIDNDDDRKALVKQMSTNMRDCHFLARIWGTLERNANMVNRALFKLISRLNSDAMAKTQALVRPMIEKVKQGKYRVNDFEGMLQKIEDGYSNFLQSRRNYAKFDYDYRVEMMKAIRDIIAMRSPDDPSIRIGKIGKFVKELTDQEIEHTCKRSGFFEYETKDKDGNKVTKRIQPLIGRLNIDILEPSEDQMLRNRMEKWIEEHTDKRMNDQYYKDRDEFYEAAAKRKDDGKPISEATKRYLRSISYEKSTLRAPFFTPQGFNMAEYLKSDARRSVKEIDRMRREAESLYVYTGGDAISVDGETENGARTKKVGEQLELAKDLQAIREEMRARSSEKEGSSEPFYRQLKMFMESVDSEGNPLKDANGVPIAKPSREEVLQFILEGGHLDFSQSFWDSITEASDEEGKSYDVNAIAEAVRESESNSSVEDADSIEELGKVITANRETIKDIIRIYRDYSTPQNIDYANMPRVVRETVLRCQQKIEECYEEIRGYSSRNDVNISRFERNTDLSEMDANEAFFDAYADTGGGMKEYQFAMQHMTTGKRIYVDKFIRKLRFSAGGKNTMTFTSGEQQFLAPLIGIPASLKPSDFREMVNKYFTQNKLSFSSDTVQGWVNSFARQNVLPYFRRFQPRGFTEFMKDLKSNDKINLLEFIRGVESGKYLQVEGAEGFSSFDQSNISFSPNNEFIEADEAEIDMTNPQYSREHGYGRYLPKLSLYEDKAYMDKFGIVINPDGTESATKNRAEWEMIQEFVNMKKEILRLYGESKNGNAYMIPQISKSDLERAGNMFVNPGSTLRNIARDMVASRRDDPWYGAQMEGDSADPADRPRAIPKYFMYELENPSDVSHDLAYSYAIMMMEACRYEAKNNAQGELMGLENAMLQGQFKTRDGSIKDPKSTHAYKMFQDWVDAYFYGIKATDRRMVKNIFGYDVDINKLVMGFERFASTMNLALSPFVAATGYLTGQSNVIIEAVTGQYMDRESTAYAIQELTRLLPSYINEIGDIGRNSKLYVVGERMGVMNMRSRMFGAGYNRFYRVAFRDPLFKPMEIASFPLNPQVLIGVLDGIRLYNDNGTERFYDIHQFKRLMESKGVKDARAEWRKLRPNSLWNLIQVKDGHIDEEAFGKYPARVKLMKQAINNARSKVRSVAQIVNGSLNEENRIGATRSWIWRFTTSHRGWMTLAAQRLYMRRGWNFETQQEEEGLVNSMISYLTNVYKASRGKSLAEKYKAFGEAFNKASFAERMNMRRALVYFFVFLAFQGLASLLFGYGDDDDNDDDMLAQFATYIGLRMINEVSSQMPVFLELNMLGSAKDPFPVATKLVDLAYWKNWSPFHTVETGLYEGNTWLFRTIAKQSFIKQWYNMSTPEAVRQSRGWWLQSNKYTMGFFYGANKTDEEDWN